MNHSPTARVCGQQPLAARADGMLYDGAATAEPGAMRPSDGSPEREQEITALPVSDDQWDEADYAEERWDAEPNSLEEELPFANGADTDEEDDAYEDSYYFILSRCFLRMYHEALPGAAHGAW